jgi:ATP-dependent RNA helicase RhlE
VVKDLYRDGISAEAIHGNKSQNARQRALNNFKTGETRVLVATDIAARGIDVDGLTHVINFDLPEVAETYVHRIGRTGRAGASGIAYSFCDEEEKDYLKGIQKLIGQQIPVIDSHPYPPSNSGIPKINLPKNKDVVRRPGAVKPPSGKPNPNKKRFGHNNNNHSKPNKNTGNDRW